MVLSRECWNARVSEIKNGRLGVYGAEHSKCNHTMTLGFRGLIAILSVRVGTLNIAHNVALLPSGDCI